MRSAYATILIGARAVNDTATSADLDLNTYEGIAEYYDVLMTAGYYDYDEYANALGEVFAHRRRILELGVGTGLVAERLLARYPDVELTGLDNTPAMLEQARARIGDRMTYALEDVTKLEMDRTFEAAYSVGGCWYFIDLGDDLELCSHIDDFDTSMEGLRRVVAHLEPGATLSLALQSPHTEYSKNLTDTLVYSQELSPTDDGFTKRYVFTDETGVVAEQSYRYLIVPGARAHAFFDAQGCDVVGLDATRTFFTYIKRGA